jgi:hypothetical protein
MSGEPLRLQRVLDESRRHHPRSVDDQADEGRAALLVCEVQREHRRLSRFVAEKIADVFSERRRARFAEHVVRTVLDRDDLVVLFAHVLLMPRREAIERVLRLPRHAVNDDEKGDLRGRG